MSRALTAHREVAMIYARAVRDQTYRDAPLGSYVAGYLRWKADEQGRSPHTIRDYEIPLAYLCIDHPQDGLDAFEGRDGAGLIREFRDRHWGSGAPAVNSARAPAGTRSVRTKNKNLSILNDFFKWCVREGHMQVNPVQFIDRPRAKTIRRRVYETGEPARLCAAAPSSRERCALEVLCEFGLRKAELCGVRLDDYDVSRRVLSVTGKGDKPRDLPVMNDRIARLLEEHWLERAALGHTGEAFLLYPVKRGRAYQDGDLLPRDFLHQPYKRLSSTATHNWFKRMLALAGIPASRKMHELRHTAATDLLRATKDISVVQQMLGHADIGTTALYTHLTQDDLREALALLAEKRAEA